MTGSANRVLILGGTAEARALAAALLEAGCDVESSLAGRVNNPRLPVGRVRIGGFGGADGLAAHLRSHPVDAVVDATHPFAQRMTGNAVEACAAVGVPLLRFVRPGWAGDPRAGQWHWVESYDRAREKAESLGERPFLTTGRQTLGYFEAWSGRFVLVRVVEPLAADPPGWVVVRDRGPYRAENELALLQAHQIDVLLTKDSGGAYTSAKLDACEQAGVPVVIVGRPAEPVGVPSATSVADALTRLGVVAAAD